MISAIEEFENFLSKFRQSNGFPIRTLLEKITFAYSVIPSNCAPPPVKTTFFIFLLWRLFCFIFCQTISKVSSIRGFFIAFTVDLFIWLNWLFSPEIIGISIISFSSLGELITDPYRVFNLSALVKVVETPLAISLVTLLLPTKKASPKIKFLFSKIQTEVVVWPKSMQIVPNFFSSSLKVDSADD